MKKFVLIMISVFAIEFAAFHFFANPCDEPIKYSIGRFDTHFGVSEPEFIKRLGEAEIVWERALGHNLFEYHSGSDFKINLVYDERQQNTLLKQRTEVGLTAAENTFSQIDGQFNVLKSEYDSATKVYGARVAAFESRREAYDAEIKIWNSKGGAPEKKYAELESERISLNQEAAYLNSLAQSLNDKAKEVNSALASRNTAASQYNKLVAIYNDKYGHGIEFNQAEYTGREINVYQFSNKSDLTLALSHEFGHALGMNHVDNSKSIMYYLTNESENNTITTTPEDITELKRVCRLD